MRYEHKCSYCGRTDHYYAKGLCAACYNRLRKNGTLEYQYPKGIGSRPDLWSEKTKKIIELYKSGMRQVDIVKEIGLTKQAVSLVIKQYVKPTNADKLRSMTDEELAEYINDVHYLLDEQPGMCDVCYHESVQNCKECRLGWLRQEATE